MPLTKRDSDFPIIRFKDFKSHTNAVFGDRKSLKAVDGWLELYEKAGTNENLQISTLKDLASSCQSYLEKKEKKALGKKPSSLLIKRIAAVKLLIAQVYLRLIYLTYEKRKSGAQNSNGALRNAERGGLGDVYHFEREHFIEQKQFATKSTLVNPLGAGFVKDQMKYAAQLQKVLPNEVQMLLNKPTNSWTFHDYKAVGKYFEINPVVLSQNPIVHFIRKDERFRHFMLFPDEGKLFRANGDLAEFPDSSMYALDTYGNLIVNKEFGFGEMVRGMNVGGQANHSSLCAGRSVICAGMIGIEKGIIVHIDNQSGHYAPSPRRLSQAIRVLIEEYDLDLPNTLKSISAMDAQTNIRKFASYEAFRNVYPPFDN